MGEGTVRWASGRRGGAENRCIDEENFRDAKDWRFGMGLVHVRIRDCDRRDRMLLVSAMAVVLLTILGAASEATGLDKTLKVNTVKHRTHLSKETQAAHQFIELRDEHLELRLLHHGERAVEVDALVEEGVYGLV